MWEIGLNYSAIECLESYCDLLAMVVLILENHGVAKGGLNPEAASRFLSPCKEDFESETERVSKAQRFY